MSHEVKTGLWATDDGSHGLGTVVTVNAENWDSTKWNIYNALVESGAVYPSDLIAIDNGWKLTDEKDISWEHCEQPAEWDRGELYCSKCQIMLEG